MCLADHETYDKILPVSVKLDVNYPPMVKLSLANNTKLIEGQSATLICEAKAKPAKFLKYFWYRNGTRIAVANPNVIVYLFKNLFLIMFSQKA